MKKTLNIIRKIAIYLLFFLLFMLLILQLTPIQNWIKNKALTQINKQLEVPLSIGKIKISFFDYVKVKNAFWGVTDKDTLVYIKELSVDVHLIDLFRNKIHIEDVYVDGLKANINKSKVDSLINISKAIGINADTTEVDTSNTTGSMEMALDRLVLSDIQIHYHDEVDSSEISTKLTKLDLRMNDLDVQKNIYNVNNLKIDGLSFTQDIYKTSTSNDSSIEDTVSTSLDYQISIEKEIQVNNLNLKLKDQTSKQDFKLEHTSFYIKPELIDLSGQNIKLQKFIITRSDVSLLTSVVQESKDQETKVFSFEDLGWNVELQQFKLNRGSFNYTSLDSVGRKISEPMLLDSIQLQLKDLVLDSTHLQVSLPMVQMRYNKKVNLKHLSANISVDESKAQVKQLKFETEKSLAKLSAVVNYGSFERLRDDLNNLRLSLELDSRLNSYDVYLITQQSSPLKKDVEINLQADVSGTMTQLLLKKFQGNIKGAFLFDIVGSINNVNSIDKLKGEVNLNKIQLNTKNLLAYIPDSLIPASVQYPDTILLKGNFKGKRDKLSSDFQVKSSVGNVEAKFKLDMDSIPQKEFYHAEINLDNLNLGYLLQNEDTLQTLSMIGTMEGSTSQFKNPALNMNLNILSFGLLNYTYKDALIKGNYSEKYFKGNVEVTDENLAFTFDGELDLEDSIPFINANLTMDYANLKALNILSDSTSVKGDINVAVTGAEWNHLKGYVNAKQLQYQASDQRYALDSLQLDLKQMTDSAVYNLKVHQIYSQDTLLLKDVGVNATLEGQKAFFDYELSGANHINSETGGKILQGDGFFQFQNDTMIVNTDLQWYQNILKKPLEMNVDLSQIKNEDQTLYNFKAQGDLVNINGFGKTYSIPNPNQIEASVKIDSLDFSLIEPLTHEYLNKFKGYLSGKIDVVGDAERPDINGYVLLKNTTINPTAVNTDFNINDGKINVNNSLVSFDHLKIQDEDKNEAFIDGTINFSELTNPVFDIKLEADQFLLLNKSESSQGNYYGKVIADLDVMVTGNTLNPNIVLTTAFNNKSDFSYIVTSSEPKAATQDDVVLFIQDTTSVVQEDTTDLDLMAVDMKGMNVTTNISLTDQLDVTLVTDPASNEKLNIVGNGDLSLSIDPSGKQTLSGQYNIKKGYYTLRLYDVIKREFTIKEGSSLTWYGDVMNANANISAIYKVRTNALSLMNVTQSELSSSESSAYNTTINIEVIMNLSGNLLSPDIDFDIVLADKNVNSNIESAITQLSNDESELNKQVLSLLVLNRFSSNKASASTTVSYEIENTARQSLSKLLSQQLNRFSNQYLKGVDVSFDIDSYNQVVENQVNTRTDLSVDVSQNLFNDRLKLTVGGNVAVEENKQNGGTSSSDLTGDFELEYKISKDGTYRVKAFNKTEYEDELNGDVTKTGLSFMFIKDFTRFSDLFKNHKKKKTDAPKEK